MAFATAAIVGGVVAGVSGLTKLGMSLAGRGDRIAEQNAAKEEMAKYKGQYENLDTSNIYAGVENQFQNLENTYEDLTVNQQQAQFEAQQGAQQRANIMGQMRGAAGGSGIAALAQAMANQGQLATQRASASIGAQEAKIQQLRAGEASRLQTLERKGEQYAEGLRLSGAETARGLEYSKTGTLLGMSQQRVGAANQARAQAKAAQMGAVGDIASAGLKFATAGMKMKPPGGETTGSGFDLSQATASGTDLDMVDPLYQSSADGYYGTGAVSIGGVGQTRFKDLSNLTING